MPAYPCHNLCLAASWGKTRCGNCVGQGEGARQGGVGQGVPDWEVLDRGARLGGAGQGTGNGGFVSWSLLYSSALEPTDWAVAACDLE